jgi:hypothetical protein
MSIPFVTVGFVQNAKASYGNCNGSDVISNNSTICIDLAEHYKDVAFTYLIQANTEPQTNHNGTATSKSMTAYPYNNIPFILPFP